MRSSSTTCPDGAPRHQHAAPRAARGFTLVSVVFILVALAALAAALTQLSVRQHMASAAEFESANAQQVARAGLEWGAFQVLRNPAPPAAAPDCFATTSFAPPGLEHYTVTVRCTRTPAGSGSISDGALLLVFYQLVANACNAPSGGTCPATGTPPGSYVERELSWTLSR